MSKDSLMDNNYDITLVDGDFIMTTPEQSLGQRIRQKLSVFRGEWFLDTSIGIPFFEEIFIKNYDLSRIETIYIRELKTIDGIDSIQSINIDLNNITRVLTVSITVISTSGEVVELTI